MKLKGTKTRNLLKLLPVNRRQETVIPTMHP